MCYLEERPARQSRNLWLTQNQIINNIEVKIQTYLRKLLKFSSLEKVHFPYVKVTFLFSLLNE